MWRVMTPILSIQSGPLPWQHPLLQHDDDDDDDDTVVFTVMLGRTAAGGALRPVLLQPPR
jgi:hypothetical protein